MADNAREVRQYPDDPQLGGRTAFRRDRDSILYTNFFRRLAGVTQVVHVAEGHIFHNRLVHSLKVAQIGRSLADILVSPKDNSKKEVEKTKQIIEAVGGIDPDVVETACLAHDLGHPPFGHIAEAGLDQCAKDYGVLDGFEGNPQSFRIVSRVAIHDGPSPGLNLTSASLNALLKYPWARHSKAKDKHGEKIKAHHKWGYYKSDRASFEVARRRETSAKRKSVEADIMDWADDITYSIHDVDDFYRAGLIPLDRIIAGGRETDRFVDWMIAKEVIIKAGSEKAEKFLVSLKSSNKSDLLLPFQGTQSQYRDLRRWETTYIKRFLGFPETKRGNYLLLLEPDGESRLFIPPELLWEVKILKGLVRCYVHEAPALLAQQHGQRTLIEELFKILFDAVSPGEAGKKGHKASPAILPKPFDERFYEIATAAQNADTARVRLVTDVIASLTEQQAVSYYARLSGTSFGFLADRIFGA